MTLAKRVATSFNRFSIAALRLCGLLAPAQFQPKFKDVLFSKWNDSLFSIPPTKISLDELSAYTPIRLNIRTDPPSVTWQRTGNLRSHYPFFEDALYHSWLNQVRPRLRSTGIDSLVDLHKIDPGLAPAGFIFHLSRCGSTLVSNMLAVPASSLVLSEPFCLGTSLILSEIGLPVARQIEIFRALLGLLGRARTADQKHVFVKFTAWNTLYLKFIKQVYPDVPWIFLYRNPLEVAVSNVEDQLSWVMANNHPRLAERQLGVPDMSKLTIEEFYARSLAKYSESALDGLDSNGMLVEYRELSESFIPRLLSFFKIEATEEEIQRMRGCFQFYSKDATRKRKHSEDGVKKVKMASPYLKEMIDRYTVASYEELKRRRQELSVSVMANSN